MNLLHIGTKDDGQPMTLPADLGDKKIALLAQSKKGKTYGLGDILEELCTARRPFIATDPANNLWGLRVLPDGKPSGLPVVVIGGPQGDIQIEKDAGERIAEALITTPQCAVIDLSMETQGQKRRFMTAFAERLMRTRCAFPLPLFLEEAPDLIPQHALGAASFCKAALTKIATIGGNFGYGFFPTGQRPATIDKDVLSQCEALIVMGITHDVDAKKIAGWVKSKDLGGRVAELLAGLGSLQPGEAWLWWPGEDRFERFTFRKRKTLHPRDMQKLGLKPAHVQLGDAQAFVEKLKADLARVVVHVGPPIPQNPKTLKALGQMAQLAAAAPELVHPAPRGETVPLDQFEKAQAELVHLRQEVQKHRSHALQAQARLEAVRKHLEPQYAALRGLFEDLGQAATGGSAAVDRAVWDPWLAKINKAGCRRMLEIMIERTEVTRAQLGTLSGVSPRGGTFGSYLSWLKTNGLVEVDGEKIRLRAV